MLYKRLVCIISHLSKKFRESRSPRIDNEAMPVSERIKSILRSVGVLTNGIDLPTGGLERPSREAKRDLAVTGVSCFTFTSLLPFLFLP